MNRATMLGLGMCAICILMIVGIDARLRSEERESSKTSSSADLVIYTDSLTGCQYLRSYAATYAALTPRMGADGKQVCTGAKP